MKAPLRQCLIVALAIATLGCGSDEAAGGEQVSGSVIAPADAPATGELPASSELIVRLEDISRADAPSTVVAEQVIEIDGTDFPIEFVLDYDPDEIDERNTYRVAARVEAGGDLIMISDTVIPVITNGAPTADVEVPLVLVAAN